jgi:hypothetical protein
MCLNNWTLASYINTQDIEDAAGLPDVNKDDDDDDRHFF